MWKSRRNYKKICKQFIKKYQSLRPFLTVKNLLKIRIQTIIAQNCPDAEHIIVDGFSKDGTVGIIKKYANKYPHIKWVSEKDNGQSDAMNKGIKMATGKIISFLNVDDFYQPNVLNKVLEIFNSPAGELPEPSFVYGNTIIWNEDDNGNYFPHHLWKPKYFTFEDLLLNYKEDQHPPNP